MISFTGKMNTPYGSKKFSLRNAPITVSNSIRRTILRDVPVAAFRSEPIEKDTIEIFKNTSTLNNEIIKHRLSLTPVHFQDLTEDIINRYQFDLNVTNETPGTIRDVTTDDFIVTDKVTGSRLDTETLRRIFPVDTISKDPVLIAKLRGPFGGNAGESLHLRGRVVIGSGKEHACFSPVSCAAYSFTVDPTQSDLMFDKMLEDEKLRRSRILGVEPDTPDLIKEEERNDLRKSFQTLDEARAYAKNSIGDPAETIFEIETIGQFSEEMIMEKAINILIEKLNQIRTIISMPARSNGKLRIISSNEDHILKFIDEEHTLGNLLQFLVLKVNESISTEGFIGYRVPHPLANEMIVRIRGPDFNEEKMKETFINAISYGIEIFNNIRSSIPK